MKMPEITKEFMISRIRSTISGKGWERTVQYILEKKIPFEKLHIAEVGCGTGTFSLVFGLLGAEVFLIDIDPQALEMAKEIYSIFKCRAKFLQKSVLDEVPEFLENQFDVVVSGGLAEHFSGDDRLRCINFHKGLLKEGGVAYIGVPNKLSPFYQMVKLFRSLTQTWKIEIEIPFTYWELERLGQEAGFANVEIVGNHLFKKDLVDYSLGMASAILDLFPNKARQMAREIKPKKSISALENYDVKTEILNRIRKIKQRRTSKMKRHLRDFFSAGIILFSPKGISDDE